MRSGYTIHAAAAALALCGMATGANAQQFPIEPSMSSDAANQNEGMRDAGRTAQTGIGEVGQRQEPAESAPNLRPLDRLESRVQNRVQNRIRNRIDRNYDPKANATSPFETAEDRARARPR